MVPNEEGTANFHREKGGEKKNLKKENIEGLGPATSKKPVRRASGANSEDP